MLKFFLKKLNDNIPFPDGLWDMALRKSSHENPSKGTLRRAAGQTGADDRAARG